MSAVFADKLDLVILSFFKIVINKGRSSILYVTAKEFINEYNVRKNIVRAIVTSAVPLNEENKRRIENIVTRATRGEAILVEKVDPKLIAGFVLKVGDQQVDTSIFSQLQKLRKEFAQKVIA